MISASSIYSTLGNSSSLVPLLIKDIANSSGMTTGSYITGDKLEAKDRFIDEVGSGAIWLFGIPFYKKIIDLTLFKAAGFDPQFDVRNFKNEKVLAKIKEFAPTKVAAANINKAIKNKSSVKALNMAKFAVSTILTIVSYLGLTELRQKHTEDCARQEVIAELQKQTKTLKNKDVNVSKSAKTVKSVEVSKSAAVSDKPVSFKGSGSFVQNFMFDPVKNTMLIDVSITGSRLGKSRNEQDTAGYAVKEGGFWLFMYILTKPIQKFFENRAEQKHNKSIGLDARVIESSELKKLMQTGELARHLSAFPANVSDEAIYEYLHKNRLNAVVKFAEQSDIIPTITEDEGKGKIDTRKYIDLEDVKDVHKKLSKLYEQYTKSKEPLDVFLSKVRSLKRGATLANIGTSIGFLGIIIPAIIIILRQCGENNKKFKVKEDIRQQMFAGV
jgi:hypothetical protein